MKNSVVLIIYLLLIIAGCGGSGSDTGVNGPEDNPYVIDNGAITDDSDGDSGSTGTDETTGTGTPVDGDSGNGSDDTSEQPDAAVISNEYNPETWHLKVISGFKADSAIQAITADKESNIYVTGQFYANMNKQVDFNPGPETDYRTGSGMFITKLNADGSYAWTKTVPGATGLSIAADSKGNIYVTGYFSGNVNFNDAGTDMHTASGSCDIFLAKINFDGTYAWTKTIGGAGTYSYADWGRSVTIDKNDNIFITGTFRGTADFNPGAGEDIKSTYKDITAADGHDNLFITKFKSDGSYAWTYTAGLTDPDESGIGFGNAEGISIMTDTFGDIYVGGRFDGRIDFDQSDARDVRVSNYGSDLFVMKISSSGKYKWVKGMGSVDGTCSVWSITIDKNNDIYAAGTFAGTVDFNTGKGKDIKTSTWLNTFIMKVGRNGSYKWTKVLDIARIGNIGCDSSNNIYLSGEYFGATDFDPGSGSDVRPATPVNASNMFVTSLDSEGIYRKTWVYPAIRILKPIGVSCINFPAGLCVSESGTVFAAGIFMTEVDFMTESGSYLKAPNGGETDMNAFIKKVGKD